MANFTLTVGADTVAGGAADDTVYGTAATLNAGDSLTGGAGTDVLALIGSGTLRVDQLASFTGFEKITLDNATNSFASLTLGSQPIEVDAKGYLQIVVNSPSNWNGSDIINVDPSHATYLYFGNSGPTFPPPPVTYDLTSNTFSNVNSISANSDNVTLLINSSDTAGIRSFDAFLASDNLVTAASTLDLSNTTVSGFRVSSTNGLGTTFTVKDLGTAFQIAGGPGQDTLIAQGFTLTANQRTEIFATGSIETITDQSGTYNALPPSPGIVGLTTGNDTFVAPASGSTVYATAATLNAGDSLTGGAGTDVLALIGSGTLRVDQLASFTGFEKITLDNATNSFASLTLGSQPIEVDAKGYLQVVVNSPSNWNGSDIINGDPSHATYLYFGNSGPTFPPPPVTYDLTSNTFSNVNSVSANSDNVTLLINSSDTAGIRSFDAFLASDNLVTAASTLDLSNTTVSGFRVSSTNGLGTTFTVKDLGTAFQIAGGPGQDTLIAQGFVFTPDQRNAIFATASVEKIVDASGTYTVDIAPTITSNGGGTTAAASILENTTAVTTVTATDPDAGQTLSYSISGGADAAKFTIGSSTGALSFVTAPNFEAPTDAGGNNVYDVTVQVSDGHGGIDTQAIAVTVTDVAENTSGDDYAASTATTGVVAVGGSSTGTIETTGDQDWFAVTLTAGETYQFKSEGSNSGQGTLPAPVLQLLDHNGNTVIGFNPGISGVTYTATSTATYYLDIGSAAGLGTYKASVVDLGAISDDYAASTATTGVVAVNGSSTGTIETTGDQDWFAVTLTAGETYQFKSEGSNSGQGTLPAPVLQLLDHNGNTVIGFNPGISGVTYTATSTATYYLDIGSAAGLGTYKASVVDLGAISDDYAASTATTGVVAVNGSSTGTIETTGDQDWFAVTLTAGETYQFKSEGSNSGQGTLPAPVLQLLDHNGNTVIGFNPGISGVTYTATSTATYYLDIGSAAGLGTYKASVVDLGAISDDYAASTATTGVVAVNGSSTGTIETTGDQDWFAVTLTAGETYQFKSEGSNSGQGTLPAPVLQLLDHNGNTAIGFNPGISGVTYTATSTATYYLDIGSAAGLGTYKVSATQISIPSNHAPVIVSDQGGETATIALAENTTAVTTVTATDPDAGQTLSYSISGGADAGKFTIGSTTGALSFVAAPNFEVPTDTGGNNVYDVTVQVSDGNGGSDTQAIAVTVTPVNDAPVAVNDSYSTNEDTTLTVAHAGVLGNDSDVDSAALTVSLVSGPAHGTVTLNADGAFSYAPAANYNGADSFTYKANDGQADSNVATVSLTVTPVNDAPVAVNDSYSTNEDTTLTVAHAGVLGNDSDVDSAALTVSLVSGPAHGTVTLNADGAFSYAPAANYNGADSFTYKANDGQADSNVATVSLTVTPVNDAPVAVNDSYSTNEDTTLTVAHAGVLGNDSDVDSAALTVSLVSGPAHGTVTLNADGAFSYAPAANYNGADSFTYKANDGQADSNVATVSLTVTPVNDAPVAVNDSYSTNEDTTLTVAHAGVLGNDSDVDSAALTVSLVSGPAHGTVTLNADGAFSYAPAANYNGADSFTYKANDGQADSNVATVSLTVTPVNDAPVANDDIAGVAKGHAITADAQHGVLVNDGDLDSDGLSVSAVNGSGANAGQAVVGTYGSLTVNTDGSYSYVANKGNLPPQIVAQDSFTYTASDGHGGTSTAQLTITITKPGAAYLAGTDGNDMLTAGNGPTVLDGGNGNDILTGGIKADALIGGHGNDTMTGGNGPDTFVFGANFGNDVITDLKPNSDAIQFDHSLFANFADVQAHAASDGHGNTVIAYDANDTITLQGVALSSLHANDFFFV